MMGTLLLTCFGLVILTFIYCGIISPTIRLRLRYRLFELRDRLRGIMQTRPDGVSQEQIDLLHSGINNAIKALPSIDFSTYYYMNKRLDGDESLRREIDKRISLLNSCNSKDFQELRKETIDALEGAFITNVAMWFLLLVPIALSILCLGKLKEITLKLKEITLRVFCIPDAELDQVMPALASS